MPGVVSELHAVSVPKVKLKLAFTVNQIMKGVWLNNEMLWFCKCPS